ncbi:MAG: DUF853 family protein [Enhydrobacter sp.]|nr:MAG: DUF853 family protein [Enhydrobacter sp.]
MEDSALFVGTGEADQYLLLKYANRHGLIAGATGTGKTVTLQTLAEGFSAHGVPVFLADVKGDLSGIGRPGADHPRAVERARLLKIRDYAGRGFPVRFWDLFGEKGHPIRTTVSEVGPVLMARLLRLNETQEGVLNIAFRVADEKGWLLLDYKDLQAMLQWLAANAAELTTVYGNVGRQTVGTIQRQLLILEQQGGARLFGEPALDLADMIACDPAGTGYVNVLAADRLMRSPRLYATFLLWLLSELFENLPEVGDPDRPKFVFFFDEAHLLFDGAPKALLERIEQVVRLIRSKGVGVYFVTQNPLDIPETVLGQLGNRVQHALRAFTPKDQKAVRASAETFRPNPQFKAAEAILELGVGEALVSFLDGKGIPTPVERAMIAPPRGRIGPLTEAERGAFLAASVLSGKYDTIVDRESAHEVLTGRMATVEPEVPAAGTSSVPDPKTRVPGGRQRDSIGVTVVKAASRSMATIAAREAAKAVFGRGRAASIGASVGGAILRGVLGSILRR